MTEELKVTKCKDCKYFFKVRRGADIYDMCRNTEMDAVVRQPQPEHKCLYGERRESK